MHLYSLSKSDLIDYIETLNCIIADQEAELQRLRGKNPRGAGRKRADEKWLMSYIRFCECYDNGMSPAETMKACQISKSTYYRYKNLHDSTSVKN